MAVGKWSVFKIDWKVVFEKGSGTMRFSLHGGKVGKDFLSPSRPNFSDAPMLLSRLRRACVRISLTVRLTLTSPNLLSLASESSTGFVGYGVTLGCVLRNTFVFEPRLQCIHCNDFVRCR